MSRGKTKFQEWAKASNEITGPSPKSPHLHHQIREQGADDSSSEIVTGMDELKGSKSLRRRGGKRPATNCGVRATAGGHFGIRWKQRIVIQ